VTSTVAIRDGNELLVLARLATSAYHTDHTWIDTYAVDISPFQAKLKDSIYKSTTGGSSAGGHLVTAQGLITLGGEGPGAQIDTHYNGAVLTKDMRVPSSARVYHVFPEERGCPYYSEEEKSPFLRIYVADTPVVVSPAPSYQAPAKVDTLASSMLTVAAAMLRK
jgi:hypothetical protein